MGLFNVRCGVSGMSTSWRPSGAYSDISMFLVERVADEWLPLTPPVRGAYSGYGGIELWPEDRNDETDWIGAVLEDLVATGRLVTSWPADLVRRGEDPAVQRILNHGCETVFNGVTLTIDGAPVSACIVLGPVVDAIAEADPHADASTWFPRDGAGRALFFDLPANPQHGRHAAVLAYARAHGGLHPLRGGVDQIGDDAEHRIHARLAWDRERAPGPLRRLFTRTQPQWAAAWQREADEAAALARAVASASARPYAPSGDYAVGDVLDHKVFGRGLVESLLDDNKIAVRFAIGARTMIHRRPR